MKKLFLFALLCVSAGASAQCTTQCFVDNLYTGGGNNGTSTNPYTSIANAMTQVNTNLATQDVTIFVSAADPTHSTEQAIDGFTTTQRTDTSTHILTLDGMSKYQTNATHGTLGGAVWATNFVPSAPANANYPGQSYAKTILTGVLQAQMTGSVPIDSSNSFSNCKGFYVIHGFDIANNNGQTVNLTYTHDVTLEYNNIHRIALGSGGPTVYIGPGQHGPCHTGAARPGGTDAGPDNVTVQYNYIHEGWGEIIYVGANSSDPFVANAACTACQQFESGASGDNLASGNGCATNSVVCATPGTPATGNTGDSYLIRGNTLESGAAWGGQGDGIDFKDGHTNAKILGNSLNTTKFPACAPTCSNLVCYGGAAAGTACTTDTPCTGGGRCGAGNDGRGMIIESCTLVDGNFVQAPGHDAIDLGDSWNTSTGRAACQVSNNILPDTNSGVGHNNSLELETLNVAGLGQWGNISFYNNSAYSAAGNGILTGAGSASGTVLIKNNIFHSVGGKSIGIGTASFNDYFSSGTCPGTETSTICTDPLFVSTAAPYLDTNFKVQSGSGARGAGTNLTGTFTNDYFTTIRPSVASWTMGAAEFTTTVVTPAPALGIF